MCLHSKYRRNLLIFFWRGCVKPPEYFMEENMNNTTNLTDAEKILVLVSKLIKYDQALQESQTREEEEKAVETIDFSLDILSRTAAIIQLYPLIRKLQIKLQKLDEGIITKQQFSCQELINRIILESARQIRVD